MALQAILDSLEGVDEGLATLYTQVGGAYRLDIEGGFKTPAEVEALSSALGKERAASAAAHKKLKEFAGIDPIAARDALKRADNVAPDGMTEAAVQQRLQPLVAERDSYKALAEERGAQLDKFSMDAALRGSGVFAKVEDPIYRESLMSKVRACLTMQDGKLAGFRADGQQVFDADGNPASGEELMSAIVASIPDVQRYFGGGTATGSGASGGAMGGMLGGMSGGMLGGAGPRSLNAPTSYAACATDAERVAYLENHHNLKGPH